MPIFQNEEPLSRAILAELLAGVSTRKYVQAEHFDGAKAACTSKSEVSRKFVKGLSALMDEFFQRRIEGDYPILMMGWDGRWENGCHRGHGD